jgi:hypothetical protein
MILTFYVAGASSAELKREATRLTLLAWGALGVPRNLGG